MSTVQTIQKKKKKIINVRARLSSLNNLNKGDENSLLAIQRSLQKYNTIDDPQTTRQQFHKENQDDIIIENKLWNYFKNKADQYEGKIQKQKVNGWHKIIKTILQQTQKKIQANQFHVEQMQAMIKNKYKQIHQVFKEIQAIKLEKQLQKNANVVNSQRGQTRRRKSTKVQTSRGQKINILYQNIQSLKKEIQSRNQQCEKIKIQLSKMKQERKSFLINLIKNGYYLSEGIKLFLQKMIEINHQLTSADLPEFLDAKSKQFIFKQYNQIKKRKDGQKQVEQRRASSLNKQRAKSNVQIAHLAKQEHFKDIYNKTKDYLLKLLLKGEWKKQQTKLPKIGQKNIDTTIQSTRQQQKKRIKISYPQQLRQKVRKIQFGVRLDTILP